MVLTSWFFYGYWYPPYLLLIVASIAANFVISRLIVNYRDQAKPIVTLGVGLNLGVLFYYKYWQFFLSSVLQPMGLNLGTLDGGRVWEDSAVKVAVTDRLASRVTVHASNPLQAPFQPEKMDSPAGIAVRVTKVPAG